MYYPTRAGCCFSALCSTAGRRCAAGGTGWLRQSFCFHVGGLNDRQEIRPLQVILTRFPDDRPEYGSRCSMSAVNGGLLAPGTARKGIHQRA
jgi:hypothetical protein